MFLSYERYSASIFKNSWLWFFSLWKKIYFDLHVHLFYIYLKVRTNRTAHGTLSPTSCPQLHYLLIIIICSQTMRHGEWYMSAASGCFCLIRWFILWLASPTFFLNHIIAAAKSLQSCPTLCDPIDGSPPGSPVPEILQARILGWVAISFSNAWKWKVKVKSLSHVRLLVTPWTAAYQAPPSILPGIFQARVLEWGAIAFSESRY